MCVWLPSQLPHLLNGDPITSVKMPGGFSAFYRVKSQLAFTLSPLAKDLFLFLRKN